MTRGGRLTLFHADRYRLTPVEATDLALEEVGERGVLAIEWADRLARPPSPAFSIHIQSLEGDRRRISVKEPDRSQG